VKTWIEEMKMKAETVYIHVQLSPCAGHVEKVLGTVSLSLKIGPILITTPMVVMPEACGYNMLLGNEIMIALQADIMGSLKMVRFRFDDVIASVPMLPREMTALWRLC
jgi:hypothetical protein